MGMPIVSTANTLRKELLATATKEPTPLPFAYPLSSSFSLLRGKEGGHSVAGALGRCSRAQETLRPTHTEHW